MPIGGDERVVGGDGAAGSKRGGDQARGARAGATCTAGGAAGPGTGGATAKATDAAAGRVLHDAGIDSAEDAASLRAKNVRARDRDVVARDREIQVVFEGEIDGVPQGEVEDPVVNQRIQSWRIA